MHLTKMKSISDEKLPSMSKNYKNDSILRIDSRGKKNWMRKDYDHYKWTQQWHRIDGPVCIETDKKLYYWIEGKIYVNFIEYIRDVIRYKKNNK